MPSLKFNKRALSIGIVMALSCNSVYAMTLEDRVERLERVSNNPVILKMTQQLNAQQREIQSIQNRLDLILHQMKQTQPQTSHTQSEFDLSAIQSQLEQLKLAQAEQAKRLLALENTDASRLNVGPASQVPVMNQPDEPAPVRAIQSPNQAVSTKTQADKPVAELKGVMKTRLATEGEGATYQDAFQLMRKSKYQKSVDAFEAFAMKHPESSLAPDAWYWAGEGYYILGNHESAKQAFEKVLEHYPGESKESDAKLRLADVLMNLQETEWAKQLYQDIIDNFPSSRAAENAKQRLQK